MIAFSKTKPAPAPLGSTGDLARDRTGRGRRSAGCICLRHRPSRGSFPCKRPAACRRSRPTLNSRIMRSTMISRWSSPIPEMIVWLRIRIRMNLERRIFLRQLVQSDAHLLLIGLGFRLDGDGNHRLREIHRFEKDLLVLIADRVAGRDVAKPDGGGDVAGEHVFDFFALVRVHLQQTADALASSAWWSCKRRNRYRRCRNKRGRMPADRQTDRS